MDSYINRFLRHTSHYALGEMLVFTASFVSFPILTRALTQADYGVMSVLSVTLWIFLAFSRAGLAEAIVRYYREYNGSGEARLQSTFYSTLFISTLAFAAVTFAFVAVLGTPLLHLIFGRDLPGFKWILAGLIVTGTFSARILNFLRAEQRTKYYNLAMVTGKFFILLVSLSSLFLVGKTLRTYYTAILSAEALYTLFLVLLFLLAHRIRVNHFSTPLLKDCLSYGFPLIGFELGYLLLKSADRYIIQIMLGSEAVGVFSVASNMGHYAKDLILFPLMYALTPIYLEIWHEKGREATSQFVSAVADISALIVVPILFGAVMLGDDLIVVLASDKYVDAGRMLAWIVPGTLLWAMIPIYAAGLYAEKKTKIISVTVLVCVVVDVVLNIAGIHLFGIMGSCYTAFVSCGVLAAYLTWLSARYLPVRLNLKNLGIALLSALLMCGAIRLMPGSHNVAMVLLKVAGAVVIYFSAVLLLHRQVRGRVIGFLGHSRFKPSLPPAE